MCLEIHYPRSEDRFNDRTEHADVSLAGRTPVVGHVASKIHRRATCRVIEHARRVFATAIELALVCQGFSDFVNGVKPVSSVVHNGQRGLRAREHYLLVRVAHVR